MALDRSGVLGEVRKIVAAPMTYEGLKEKANAFLSAVDTAAEKSSFHVLLEEIKSTISGSAPRWVVNADAVSTDFSGLK